MIPGLCPEVVGDFIDWIVHVELMTAMQSLSLDCGSHCQVRSVRDEPGARHLSSRLQSRVSLEHFPYLFSTLKDKPINIKNIFLPLAEDFGFQAFIGRLSTNRQAFPHDGFLMACKHDSTKGIMTSYK
jgi:hypothetical protein